MNLNINLEPGKGLINDNPEAGRELRKHIPRNSHAQYKINPKRKNPVEILEEQAKTRTPSLMSIKYSRMLASPFAFLRGTAAIMAQDLSVTPVTGINVQTCGDMHISNFGIFASAEKNLIFGINDFDETYPAAWEWDLKRLITSIIIAGRYLKLDKTSCNESVHSTIKSYKKNIRKYSELGYLNVWYSTLSESNILNSVSKKMKKEAKKLFDKAQKGNNLQVLDKLSDIIDKHGKFREDIPLITREKQNAQGKPAEEIFQEFLNVYKNSLQYDRQYLLSKYKIMDIARKVVGIGSVGLKCWIIYLCGKDNSDPLFLQVKEAQHSVLEQYFTKSEFKNQGQRIVAGQRLIQGAPDIFLGWGESEGVDYYVRQMRDIKESFRFDPGKESEGSFAEYCDLCATALSLAHAQSGNAAQISGYMGKSDELDHAFAKWSNAYADQVEKDYEFFVAAAGRNEIPTLKQKTHNK